MAVADSHAVDYGPPTVAPLSGSEPGVDRLHANQPKAHLTLIGNDLPSNDNIALANNGPADPPRSEANGAGECPQLLRALVAPNSVSFGFSATACIG